MLTTLGIILCAAALSPLQAVKAHLAMDATARAPNPRVEVPPAPETCMQAAQGNLALAVLSPSAGDPNRVVVEWPAQAGMGMTRVHLWVKDGMVMDTRAHVAAGEAALRNQDDNGALKWANQALMLDPGNAEALALVARVSARLGDFERAHRALQTARKESPESTVTFSAAYEVMLRQQRMPEAEEARKLCMDASTVGNWGDAQCAVQRAVAMRGRDDGGQVKADLEEALKRNPHSPPLHAELAILMLAQSNAGNAAADKVLIKRARDHAQQALLCPAAIEKNSRAATYHAQAASALELGGQPCAALAENAILLDPTVVEHRRTLLACADAALLWANVQNRSSGHDAAVDLDVEARAINAALLRDAPMLGGRRLPAPHLFTRVKVSLRVVGDHVDVGLLDAASAKKVNPPGEALAAAFMVYQVYAALYGGDKVPRLGTVRTQWVGELKEYAVTMPEPMKPAWQSALPSGAEWDALLKDVRVRSPD